MYGFNQHHLSNFDRKSVLSPKKKKRKYSVDNNNTINNLSLANNSSSLSSNRANSESNTATNKTFNIIDRVLDLSKYNKDTGLYTLSRDWINATTSVNEASCKSSVPAKKANASPNDSQIISEEKKSNQENSYYITHLPDPVHIENQIDLGQLNGSIKKNIRYSEANDIELIKTLNVDEFMQTHALLKLHVNRWKQARKEWVNFYNQTNKPYKNSYDSLRSILEEYE